MNVYYVQYIVHKCRNTAGQFLQSLRTSNTKKIEECGYPYYATFV